jgi:peptide chain release factor 1
MLEREGGGHRWQRIPPTEKRGRVQTSTVTVAVLDLSGSGASKRTENLIDDRDIEMVFTKDTGPGGQHRNKTESCVVLTHRPTGIKAKSADRCQHANRRQARAVLEERVAEYYATIARRTTDDERRRQVGSGERGDKIRTYSLQHDIVHDHRSDRKASAKKVLAGDLGALWS